LYCPPFCLKHDTVKPSKIVAVLLVLNLGLFAGILAYVLRARIVSPVSVLSEPGKTPQSGNLRPLAAAPSSPTVVVVTNELKWAQLESEDYKTYIARLRSIGCPEQTIRDIIIADLDKLLAPQIAAAHGRRTDLKYWHPEEAEVLNDVNPKEVFKKQREIDQRKREIIRELVDTDLARERMKTTGVEDYYERRLSFLPEDRRTQLRELLERFDENEEKLREKETQEEGALSSAERAQLRALRQQRETEVARLLSPQEKEQYELWMSPTANEVRHALYNMNATEQEFLTIYSARKAFEEAWADRDSALLDAASRAEMEKARADMEGQIISQLGEERYAEYKRGQDDDYHMLSALVTRFSLPKERPPRFMATRPSHWAIATKSWPLRG
jgi:hypothetical protein